MNNDLLLVLVVAGMVSPIVDTDVGRLVFKLVRGHFEKLLIGPAVEDE